MLEYLPSTKRAAISIAVQIFWSLGSIFEYLMGMMIVPTFGWRMLTILSAIPVGIIAISIFVCIISFLHLTFRIEFRIIIFIQVCA